jgi:hypothetical protein
MDFLNHSIPELMELGKAKNAEYCNAAPFPYIYFDDFFNPEYLNNILGEFPDFSKTKDIHYKNANEDGKYATRGEYRLGSSTRSIIHALNSQIFLEFLQNLTGIKEALIPDPYLEGGGFHQIKPGGFLRIHVDFHRHKLMNLDRRLNLLVYLNPNWKEEYGGNFELWERDMSKCALRIAPKFNRMVVFSTTDYSWHGHPDPLTCPEGMSRKSLALYYYSNGRPDNEIGMDKQGRITTTFAARKGKDPMKMRLYNNAVNLANDILPPIVVRMIKKRRNT